MAFGANGILGVGLFQQDCGPACTSANQTIPAVYYDCPHRAVIRPMSPLRNRFLIQSYTSRPTTMEYWFNCPQCPTAVRQPWMAR